MTYLLVALAFCPVVSLLSSSRSSSLSSSLLLSPLFFPFSRFLPRGRGAPAPRGRREAREEKKKAAIFPSSYYIIVRAVVGLLLLRGCPPLCCSRFCARSPLDILRLNHKWGGGQPLSLPRDPLFYLPPGPPQSVFPPPFGPFSPQHIFGATPNYFPLSLCPTWRKSFSFPRQNAPNLGEPQNQNGVLLPPKSRASLIGPAPKGLGPPRE